jgi:hypothetical protein
MFAIRSPDGESGSGPVSISSPLAQSPPGQLLDSQNVGMPSKSSSRGNTNVYVLLTKTTALPPLSCGVNKKRFGLESRTGGSKSKVASVESPKFVEIPGYLDVVTAVAALSTNWKLFTVTPTTSTMMVTFGSGNQLCVKGVPSESKGEPLRSRMLTNTDEPGIGVPEASTGGIPCAYAEPVHKLIIRLVSQTYLFISNSFPWMSNMMKLIFLLSPLLSPGFSLKVF